MIHSILYLSMSLLKGGAERKGLCLGDRIGGADSVSPEPVSVDKRWKRKEDFYEKGFKFPLGVPLNPFSDGLRRRKTG